MNEIIFSKPLCYNAGFVYWMMVVYEINAIVTQFTG